MRVEQVEHVAWGGKPDRSGQYGPMGERLTPRGSFDAWIDTVRGCAHPWEDGTLTHTRMTLAELARVSNTHRTQLETTRSQLLAMPGHDLRDPLHSINMAGMVLEKTGGESNAGKGTLGRRIQSSSNRMQRMIGQVLDMSRIDRGLALGVSLERGSLHNPRNRTGIGLGLYIAQQIVREHRGELDYRHADGEVIFTLRLPQAPAC